MLLAESMPPVDAYFSDRSTGGDKLNPKLNKFAGEVVSSFCSSVDKT